MRSPFPTFSLIFIVLFGIIILFGLGLSCCDACPDCVQVVNPKAMHDDMTTIDFTYPLEGGDKKLTAYVNQRTGIPYSIRSKNLLRFDRRERSKFPTDFERRHEIDRLARSFFHAHSDLFRVDTTSFSDPRISFDGQLWYISYKQVIKDSIEIFNSELGITLNSTKCQSSDDEGCIVSVGAYAYPTSDLLNVGLETDVSTDEAYNSARASSGLQFVQDSARLVIFPRETTTELTYTPAWKFVMNGVVSGDSLSTTFLVGAVRKDQGRIQPLLQFNNQFNSSPSSLPGGRSLNLGHKKTVFPRKNPSPNGATISGTVTLDFMTSSNWPVSVESHLEQPFKYAKVILERNSGDTVEEVEQTFADGEGFYEFEDLSSGQYFVKFVMANPKASIISDITNSEKSGAINLGEGENFTQDHYWEWEPEGDNTSQRAIALNTIYHIGIAHDYVLNQLESNIDDSVTINVIVSAGEEGSASITSTNPEHTYNMFIQGHYGQSDEIIIHEYMHTVIQEIYETTSVTPVEDFRALTEGISDYFSGAIKGDFAFAGPGPDITERYLINAYTWDNYATSNDEYEKGSILGSALWSLRNTHSVDLTSSTENVYDIDKAIFTALQLRPRSHNFQSLWEKMLAIPDTLAPLDWNLRVEKSFVEEKKIGQPNEPVITNIQFSETNSNKARIVWEDNSGIETGFRIKRSIGGGSFQTIDDSLGPNVTEFEDLDVCPGDAELEWRYKIEVYRNFPNGTIPIPTLTNESDVFSLRGNFTSCL